MKRRKQSLKTKPSVRVNVKRAILITSCSGILLTISIYLFSLFFGNVGVQQSTIAAGSYSGVDTQGYTKERILMIDHSKVDGASALTDFPVLISITHEDLKTHNNGGDVTHPSGYDIGFTDISGRMLHHQIEEYDGTTGSYLAWVRVPTLSAIENTEIHILYGKATVITNPSSSNVWTEKYKSIWHMDVASGSTTLQDATSNANAGTSNGNMSTSNWVAGKIGQGVQLDGVDDYFNFSGYKGINNKKKRTISFWFNSTEAGRNHRVLSWGKNSSGKKYDVGIIGANNSIAVSVEGGEKYGSTNIADGNWHYLTIVLPRGGGNKKVQMHQLYVDGILEVNTGGNNLNLNTARNGNDVVLGKGNWNCCFTKGIIDEVRISQMDRSAGWISTEFNNQNDPENFIHIGDLVSSLPIELASFEVERYEEVIEVLWETATEINNDFFTIEKSKDGFHFNEIAKLEGAGNSSQEIEYSFVDEAPYEGINYYRLKQTDFDGKFEYFEIKGVKYEGRNQKESLETSLSVSPNPFTSHFNLAFHSSTEGQAQLYIIDMNGKQVFSDQIQTSPGSNVYMFSEGDKLIQGTYVLNLFQKEQTKQSIKLIKK